jgi:hypothetical protein
LPLHISKRAVSEINTSPIARTWFCRLPNLGRASSDLYVTQEWVKNMRLLIYSITHGFWATPKFRKVAVVAENRAGQTKSALNDFINPRSMYLALSSLRVASVRASITRDSLRIRTPSRVWRWSLRNNRKGFVCVSVIGHGKPCVSI